MAKYPKFPISGKIRKILEEIEAIGAFMNYYEGNDGIPAYERLLLPSIGDTQAVLPELFYSSNEGDKAPRFKLFRTSPKEFRSVETLSKFRPYNEQALTTYASYECVFVATEWVSSDGRTTRKTPLEFIHWSGAPYLKDYILTSSEDVKSHLDDPNLKAVTIIRLKFEAKVNREKRAALERSGRNPEVCIEKYTYPTGVSLYQIEKSDRGDGWDW